MRRLLSVLIGASLLLASASFVWPGEEKDARGVIEKAIKAVGGEKALAKHNAITFKESGTYYGMGNGLPYTGNYAIQWPGQFRMEIVDVFTIVLDGDKGWIKMMGEVKEMSKEQLATHKHDHRAGYMSTLLPLRDKAVTLKLLKEAKVDKHDTQVVQASRKDWPEMKLYFDKTSNLLVKIEYKTKSAEMGFKEVSMDTIYSEYKEVAGARIPHKMVMHRDGKVFVEAEVTEMNAVGKLDAKTFARPD